MDEFSPTYSARDEIQQRIDVLQTRADTYYTKRIAEAEDEVQRYRDGQAEDARMAAEWRAVLATMDRSPHRPPCVDGEVCGGPHCPPPATP